MAVDINQIIALYDEINKRVYYDFISNLFLVIVIAVTILLSVEITGYIIKRSFKKTRKFPHEAFSGFLNFIRMIVIFIVLFSVLVTLGIMDYETLMNFTTIFSTAIGLASAIIVGNLIAGFFMIGSRPYSVGDFIKIGEIEGFVTEIGMNYTILRDTVGIGNIHKIPNKVAMNANLLNYKTVYEEDIKAFEVSKKEKIKKTLIKAIQKRKISYYFFLMEFELDKNPKDLIRILDEVCERWVSKFGHKPRYVFANIYWRLTIRMIISSEDMNTAMDLLPEFKKDIWFSVYEKSGGSK